MSGSGSRQQVVGFSTDQFDALLKTFQSGQKSSSGSGALSSTAIAITGLSKLTQSARENIDAREPFNVASLCADNVRRLKIFSNKKGHYVRGEDNSVIWDKEESVDAPVEMSLNPTCVRSGLEKYVQMHGELKSQEIRDRVPNILKRMYTVWEYQVADKTRTCRYTHEFIQKYVKEDNWAW